MDLKKLRNESDIRGVASEGIEGQHINLTDEAIYELACGFFAWLGKRVGKDSVKVGVGRDSRISGPRILEAIKKAAADMPDVVGSMLDGAFHMLAAVCGIGVGIGATVFVQNIKKKKETAGN